MKNKNFIKGFTLAIVVFLMYSYTTTEGRPSNATGNSYFRDVLIHPLKQKNIIVTRSYDYMKKLLIKGYVCEDIDIIKDYRNSQHKLIIRKYYTLIKY